MNKAKLDFAVNVLRKGSYYWEARTKAKSDARIRRGYYTCAICKGETRAKDMNLDHINPVKDVRGINDNLHVIAERLLADSGGWQCLCKPCHLKKTNIENTCRDEIEASVKRMNKELSKLYEA